MDPPLAVIFLPRLTFISVTIVSGIVGPAREFVFSVFRQYTEFSARINLEHSMENSGNNNRAESYYVGGDAVCLAILFLE